VSDASLFPSKSFVLSPELVEKSLSGPQAVGMETKQVQGSSGSFEVFFDGACPLCAKEIDFLRWLDRGNILIFTDIDDPGFNAEVETGRSFQTLMDSIHGRLSDGTIIHGVEVFRQLYGRTALSWAVAFTRLPGITQGLDALYTFFARYRLRITGRCTPELCQPKADTLPP
jgi:predicted DCC family thiol-disulfide oxidoreductase YuxK